MFSFSSCSYKPERSQVLVHSTVGPTPSQEKQNPPAHPLHFNWFPHCGYRTGPSEFGGCLWGQSKDGGRSCNALYKRPSFRNQLCTGLQNARSRPLFLIKEPDACFGRCLIRWTTGRAAVWGFWAELSPESTKSRRKTLVEKMSLDK